MGETMRLLTLAATAVLSISALAAAQLQAQTPDPTPATSTEPHWDYIGKYGPINWGKLDPAWRACSKGKEQSPIDIRHAHLNKALKPIEFHYMAGPVTIVNNGHTIQVDVQPGSYIVVGGERYDLVQFHFHHPSEEAVKGKLSDMVIHLVHRSADGKLAVIAILLNEDRGDPNAVLATIWDHMPTAAGQSVKLADMIDPGGLLPADRGYWTYMGSLTTPPCTEGVRWFVLEQSMSISRVQLRAFAALYRVNSRPLQDPNGRKVEANEK
jgi:carbonic anhydrase